MATRKNTKKAKKAEPELIPSVGYLRKSTKGKQKDGRQRQESSLARQKEAILALAKGKYEIVAWFEDDGVSGSKLGAKRPGFHNMVNSVEGLGAKAIICEKLDRFSRASRKEIREVVTKLEKAGVVWVVTRGTTYDLTEEDDLGQVLTFEIDLWAACKFSKDLSERILMGQLRKVLDGKRPSGPAPYGMAQVKDALKPGKASEIKVVRFVFDSFGKGMSMNAIITKLNQDGVKPSSGKKWFVMQAREMLSKAAYVGDLSWNEDNTRGKHFAVIFLDGKHQVVKKTPGMIIEPCPIIHKNKWKGIISRKTFNAAQKRLETIATTGRKPRGKYPLSGVLVCENCGGTMTRAFPKGRKPVYRCATPMKHGAGACGSWEIAEDLILPYVLGLLNEEMERIEETLASPSPPKSLRSSQEQQAARERQREALEKQIKQAGRNAARATDPSMIDAIQEQVQEWRAELASLIDVQTPGNDDDAQAVMDWFRDWRDSAIRMDPDQETMDRLGDAMPGMVPKVLADPQTINAALLALGAEVRLLWKAEPKIKADGEPDIRHGKQRMKNKLVRGRFRLGQAKGKISRQDLARFACRPQ